MSNMAVHNHGIDPSCPEERQPDGSLKGVCMTTNNESETPETDAVDDEIRGKRMSVHFSSATDLWATPQEFFDRYNEIHGFDLDVCASPENAKCPRYFTKEDDGLSQEWEGACWMNPPYGREIGAWMKKAYESSRNGATVVCLVPARTDTAWWHDYATKGRIEFIRGRLKFGGHKNPAPFPSAVVVFRPPPPIPKPHEPHTKGLETMSKTPETVQSGKVGSWEYHRLIPCCMRDRNRDGDCDQHPQGVFVRRSIPPKETTT